MSGDTAAAYSWTKKEPEPLPPVPDLESGSGEGIDGTLDEFVKGVLEETGMLDVLEKVTGMPEQLISAADEWHAQAKALQGIADALRMGAAKLPAHWQGEASESFGHAMKKVVTAIDDTAAEAGQTASILSSAAEECKLAEDTVIGIIREAIEWLAITMAAGLITDLLTLGLSTAVHAMVVEAEMVAFVARVEQASVKLGKALRELMEKIKEMRQAERSFKRFNEARKAAKGVRKAGGLGGLRGEGGTHQKLIWEIQHEGYKQLKENVYVPAAEAAGLDGLSGKPTDPLKDALGSDTAKQAYARDSEVPDEPYYAPKRSIEEEFG